MRFFIQEFDSPPEEVSEEEYARHIGREFFWSEEYDMKKVARSATRDCPLAGTVHLFWTEKE